MNSRKQIESLDLVQRLLGFIKHLIEGIPGEDEAKDDPYEFEESQTYAAKLINLVDCKDPVSQFQAICLFKEAYDKGGIQRMKYTIPSIVYAIYKLIQKYFRTAKLSNSSEEEEKVSSDHSKGTPTGSAEGAPKLSLLKVYQFIYKAIESIGTTYPETGIRLLLQGVLSMNYVVPTGTEAEELGYQFASHALVLYQDELSDVTAKNRALTLIIGTLQKANFFSTDNFETLTSNAQQYCGKLLKKEDQCKAFLVCTHMFASELSVLCADNIHRKSQQRLRSV